MILSLFVLRGRMNKFKLLPCVYCESDCWDLYCEDKCLFIQAWREMVDEQSKIQKRKPEKKEQGKV